MMAVVWLVPFNTIQLTFSLPIDLKFDRLVLPVIFAVWALMVAIGGPLAPGPALDVDPHGDRQPCWPPPA